MLFKTFQGLFMLMVQDKDFDFNLTCQVLISKCKRLKVALPLEMKHFVAISLVFFSLTQLARADRAEGLRLITEGYCNQQQVATQKFTQQANSLGDQLSTYFLTSSELASIGTRCEVQTTKYSLQDQNVSDLIVVGKPNNNSP